jgi:hypothetical protein
LPNFQQEAQSLFSELQEEANKEVIMLGFGFMVWINEHRLMFILLCFSGEGRGHV